MRLSPKSSTPCRATRRGPATTVCRVVRPLCRSGAAEPQLATTAGFRASAAASLASLAIFGGALAPGNAFADVPGLATPTPALTPDTHVYDSGRLLGTDKRVRLDAELSDLEARTGWKVRVLTSYGPGTRPAEEDLRAAWGPLGKRSMVIEYDATAPSLINPIYLGDDVFDVLRRPWWYEFKGRFGNMFFVRENGEQAAILQSTSALVGCLNKGGCLVVPGLPEEQYYLTLIISAVAGVVAGFASRLEPQGFISSRWIWVLLFSPLWGSCFVNFGLGPVVTRTDDKLPIIGNVLGFAAGALSPYAAQLLRAPPVKQEE
ncbi:hypothetical protein HYH03_011158 [Edaphochlamys debaryana]|uniref:TPM domain-containing protein n=1 Tax=Edaphochlamys debaryana TaxID=47281 RepID=A0A835XXS5_9CHLO|nr:hypothetical protein HYH03_011158 [Edaphochlamys debaryana]|eukprot:KAG2490356.1 hypothetical protein HYH03_011158 [Edaphochlamys debaryana]